MTPAQLENLRLLKAHLESLLEDAKHRTPGEWIHELSNDSVWNEHDYFSQIAHTESNQDRYAMIQDADQRRKNATFIASCAGNAEAGWQSTLTAISGLSEMARMIDSSVPEYEGCGRDAVAHLEKILAAWPIETLTSKPKNLH